MGVDEALGFGEDDGETPGVSDGLGVCLGVGVGFGLFDGVGDFVGNGASVGVIPLELRAFGEKEYRSLNGRQRRQRRFRLRSGIQ